MAYFEWLVRNASPNPCKYTKLLYILYNRPYYSPIEGDKNRIVDGRYLRDTWLKDHQKEAEVECIPPFISVLEVLLALSKRVNNQIFGDETDTKWFWKMIVNLGLGVFDDDYSGFSEVKIDEILKVWLDRKYAFNGTGSPFPITKKCHSDQRKLELWYQFYTYCYIIEDD